MDPRDISGPHLELPGGDRLALAEGLTTIGRSSACELPFDSAMISRRHCELHRDGERVRLVNLSRKNPAWVDGDVVDVERELCDGDDIRLPGGIELTYRQAAPVAGAAAVKEDTVELFVGPEGELVGLTETAAVVVGGAAPLAATAPEDGNRTVELDVPPPSKLVAPVATPEAERGRRAPAWLFSLVLLVGGAVLIGLALRDPKVAAPRTVRSVPVPAPVTPQFEDDGLGQLGRFADLPDSPTADEGPAWLRAPWDPEAPAPTAPRPTAPPTPRVTPPATGPGTTTPPLPTPRRVDPRPAPTPAAPGASSSQPGRTPAVQTPVKVLPTTRPPLVRRGDGPADRANELESRTVRLETLEKIIAGLAERIAPRVQRATGSTTLQPRLIIWLVDLGPQAVRRGLVRSLGALVPRLFGDRQAIRHALVSVGRRVEFGGPLVTAEDLGRALRRVERSSDAEMHDLMRVAAACTERYPAGEGERALVVVSIDNHDLEGPIESTLSKLRRARMPLFVVSPEVLTSDSFWFCRPDDPAVARARPLGLRLAGAEAPLVELPYGWRSQKVDPPSSVPAAFGAYAWNRLAVGSGGAHYLHNPGSGGRSFCARMACAICRGAHRECATIYHEHRLEVLEPTALGRSWYAGKLSNTHASYVRRSWAGLARAGIVTSTPPRSIGPVPRKKPKKQKAAPENGWLWNGGVLTMRRNDLRELQTLVNRRRQALSALAGGPRWVRPQGGTPFERRALANAGWMRLMLVASHLTLIQQQHALVEAGRKWPKGEGQARVLLEVEHVPLCHGTAPLRQLEWAGGTSTAHAFGLLGKVADPMLRWYGGTPWELLIRRVQIARYTVRVLPPVEVNVRGNTGRGNTGRGKRGRVGKPPKRPKPPVTPTPKRPSRGGGGGGSQTGGDSTISK